MNNKNLFTGINNQENNFSIQNLEILSLRYQDIYQIMDWRNEQKNVLRQTHYLTRDSQLKYYQNYISPSLYNNTPNLILFSFLEDEKLIGYGGFVHIDWESKRAEISFLLATKLTKKISKYSYYFSYFLDLIKCVGFHQYSFNRLFTETFSFRKDHINILEKSGAIFEGCLREHIYEDNKKHDSFIHSFLKSEHNCSYCKEKN